MIRFRTCLLAGLLACAASGAHADEAGAGLTANTGGGNVPGVWPMCRAPASQTDGSAGKAVECGTHGTAAPAAGGGGSTDVSALQKDATGQSSIAAPGAATAKGQGVQDSASGAPLALAGMPIAGATMPAGGGGTYGWLSAIWARLGGILSTAPASFAPAACSNATVGTTPTLILDSVANGGKRVGGGFKLPAGAANPIYFSWLTASPTTTEAGGTFALSAGGTIPFAGAPNTALYAIAAVSTPGSCMQ